MTQRVPHLERHFQGPEGEVSWWVCEGIHGVVSHDTVVTVLPTVGHHFLMMIFQRGELRQSQRNTYSECKQMKDVRAASLSGS